ncbi:DNA-directed RNA polymerase subunit sigma [Paenibacillus sp. FSL R5-0345]|uniref:RNA polymerase sigma factor n=1 Tax=Paenibacillus sp. FSL R5-0345 TaxID=1536770 RepID=UPI0004F75B3F|nr:RNA polymerase sigma factor [Paenibacillus sp. FSL R5-0345]AIQ37339.1 DNA-directed RNA polymerase subunit sigma [Paenibacillus sp. FSL R5-0345]
METNRELFEAYNKDVYRTCYYMVHDAADAEDLTQDVFITVFRTNRENVEHMKAWIMKITVNHCLNHLKRKRTLQQKVSDNLYLFKKSPEIPVERLIEQRETTMEWAKYLSQLPVKLRMVITLRYMHDFSLAEVSDLLSIPLGTTKSRLHKGLKVLRRILLEAGVQIERKEGESYEKVGEYAGASVK